VLQLATVGEDSVLNVFSLPSANSKEVALLATNNVKNIVISGVQFFAEDLVAISAYDTKGIIVFSLK